MTSDDRAALPAHVRDNIREGAIHMQAAGYFSPYAREDLDAFLKTFAALCLSVQTQREFAEWIGEIASRDGMSIPAVLAQRAFTDTLENSRLNPPQKIAKVREALFEHRFPLYAATLERWRTAARQANPDPKNVLFTPSPGFEKDRLEVKVTATTGCQAKELFTKLAALPQEVWDGLVNPAQR